MFQCDCNRRRLTEEPGGYRWERGPRQSSAKLPIASYRASLNGRLGGLLQSLAPHRKRSNRAHHIESRSASSRSGSELKTALVVRSGAGATRLV